MEMNEVLRQKSILKHRLLAVISDELDAFEKATGLTPADISVYMVSVDTLGRESRNELADITVRLGL